MPKTCMGCFWQVRDGCSITGEVATDNTPAGDCAERWDDDTEEDNQNE